MEYFLIVVAIYFGIGLWFVFMTNSRGIVADALFALLWPLYWYDDWKNGRL